MRTGNFWLGIFISFLLIGGGFSCSTMPKIEKNLYQEKMQSVKINGFKMNYVEIGPKNADPIIFLHGYTDSLSSWATTAPLLKDKYHVFVIDQRGHGDSEKPQWGYTTSQFGNDVIAFMDALKIKKAILVGHSMGSFIAHYVAAIYPDRVSALVLISSAKTVVGNPGGAELYKIVSAPDFKDPVNPSFIKEWQACPFPVNPDFLARQAEQCAKVPVRVWRAALLGLLIDDHSAFLQNIKVPTLIIWGDKDNFFSISDQNALKEAISGSVLKIYANTGHNVQWEGERNKKVAADIRSFLERHNL